MNAIWGLLCSGPSFPSPYAILGCSRVSCSFLVMYFGFAQPFFPLVAALSPLEHPPHSSMGCERSLRQASTILLSQVDFRKAVCKRHTGNWRCTRWVEGRWLSPHLHHQWKGFAMTTSLTCTVNLQLPWFKVCSWICLQRFVCCVPLLFVCFSFEPCFWDFFFPCDRQPHLRADSHLQTGWHCNGVGFGQAGRCGCRNLLPDMELVWVLKIVEGWMNSDRMLFSVSCSALRKSPLWLRSVLKCPPFWTTLTFLGQAAALNMGHAPYLLIAHWVSWVGLTSIATRAARAPGNLAASL